MRGWNPVDDILDQFSPCADVTLVVSKQFWVVGHEFEDLIREYFPSMWEKGKVVLEVAPPDIEEQLLMGTEIPPIFEWLETRM